MKRRLKKEDADNVLRSKTMNQKKLRAEMRARQDYWEAGSETQGNG
jgi:hypothetical protein